MQKTIILVDENDQQVGTSEKLAAHEQGLLHRAFSAFVFRTIDGCLEVLLQQRAAGKYHSANLWTNTCCSHPAPGETVLGAAHRRLKEEFGFTVTLQTTDYFIYKAALEHGLVEYELDHVLIGTFIDEKIQPNPKEIADYQWVSVKTLVDDLKLQPQKYTVWLKEALNVALEHRSQLA